MSDSDSASSSDSEDLNTTGLIATRAKRSTAGNLYASLRANLDDEELQKELLAEDAEDVGDYEGSDKEGDDDEDAFESSSDEDDQGPPKEGEDDDLEGEKQLKKLERAEAKKKRSVKDARLKVPGGHARATKRVRLAEGLKGGDEESSEPTAPKPKKKSERSNWLPTAEDGPVRQSGRALAVANREIVHANLTASAARSDKQRRVMKAAAEREKSKSLKHAELTQEERLRKCEKVEKETAKELGRFEQEEAERQRAREEALAAKRRRGITGPVYRVWSGSCVWEGERVKVGKVEHGSFGKGELISIGKPKVVDLEAEAGAEISGSSLGLEEVMPNAVPAAGPSTRPADGDAPMIDPSVSWLQGIEQYAAQPTSTPATPKPATGTSGGMPVNGFAPSAPATNTYATPATYPAPAVQPSQQPTIYHGWPPGASSYPASQQVSPAPPPPPVREQAQRTLLMLEDFPELAIAPEPAKPTKRKSLYTAAATTTATATAASKADAEPTSTLTPSALQTLLLPDSYPPLTPVQSTYLFSKPRKKGFETTLPSAPPRARCAMTQWEAKFRDPKTGVPYNDLHAYKALQRALSGGCAWSGMLGAWVGASMGNGKGGVMGTGRAARGVPGGFNGGGSGGGGMKVEGS